MTMITIMNAARIAITTITTMVTITITMVTIIIITTMPMARCRPFTT